MNRQTQSSPSIPFVVAALVIVALSIITACAASSAATEPPLTPTPIPETATPTPLPPTANPVREATPTASSTPTPTLTPTIPPTPTATPTPGLRQLTSGGCCVQPFFSPDGQQVFFIDKPADNEPVGIYGVDLTDPEPTPVLINPVIGFRSTNHSIVATLQGDLVELTREETGESWVIDTGGNWPNFSPDAEQIIWVATDREGPYDRRQSDVWLADITGDNAQLLRSLYGGGPVGWLPDGERILLTGRDDPEEEEVTMFVYNLQTEQRTDLFRHKRLRGIEISPEGTWLVFFITFADDAAENGLWVMRSDGSKRHQLDVPGFGAYRWRDDDTLLYIPMRAVADDSMQLWTVDAATGQSQPLTDPTTFFFSIANGDWDVSPDGQHVIFVNSADQNIWLITLP